MPNAKRSWPLLLLAACSLIPGFGLVFGSAGVSWGLVSDRPRARLAVGLGAAGALLNLIGVGWLLWHLQQQPAFASVSARRSRADLNKLVVAIESYHKDTGIYPARLDVFTQLPYSLKLINIQDFSAGVFRRPREYQYQLAPDGRTYTLSGIGADGQPGTADDVYPRVADSAAGRRGLRRSREPGGLTR
jgi:hypothetical protein